MLLAPLRQIFISTVSSWSDVLYVLISLLTSSPRCSFVLSSALPNLKFSYFRSSVWDFFSL